MILVTGGAGFIAPISCSTGSPRATSRSSISTPHLRRQSRQPRAALRRPAARLRARRHRRPRAGRAPARGAPAAGDPQLRRREPRRPLDPRPGDFVATNVVGTFNLLDVAKAHWQALPDAERSAFRFLHVSTDEVYGSLVPPTRRSPRRRPMRRTAPTQRRRRRPTIWCAPITIPTDCPRSRRTARTTTAAAVPGEADPADDRERARRQAASRLRRRPERPRLALRRRSLFGAARGARRRAAGETYNIGGNAEIRNIDVVNTLCACSPNWCRDAISRA